MMMEMQQPQILIPRGFRFKPTDYELVDTYLQRKVIDERRRKLNEQELPLPPYEIETIDLYENHTPAPWELFQSRGLSIKNEVLYCFTELKSKSDNNDRTTRKTDQGTWLQQGTKPVRMTGLKAFRTSFSFFLNDKVTKCIDKTGGSSGWIMKQFMLEGDKSWTICKIHFRSNKNNDNTYVQPEQGMLLGASSSSDQAIRYSTIPFAEPEQGMLLGPSSSSDHEAIHYSTRPIAVAAPMNKLPTKSLKRKLTNINGSHELNHNSSKQQHMSLMTQSVMGLSAYSQNIDYHQPQSSHIFSPVFQNPPEEPSAATDGQDTTNNILSNFKSLEKDDNITFKYSELFGEECGEKNNTLTGDLDTNDYLTYNYDERNGSSELMIQGSPNEQISYSQQEFQKHNLRLADEMLHRDEPQAEEESNNDDFQPILQALKHTCNGDQGSSAFDDADLIHSFVEDVEMSAFGFNSLT